jgi:glucan phosphoethanolaminetransferase (alkaline phosphatase superfamily)
VHGGEETAALNAPRVTKPASALVSITRTGSYTAWAVLLAAPSATVYAPSHDWDIHPLATFAVTFFAFAVLWFVTGRRLFFVFTYPLVLFGTLAMAADFSRNVDILELVLVGATGSRDVAAALIPYSAALAALAALLCLQVWIVLREHTVPSAARRGSRPLPALIAAALASACLWAWSPGVFARAWPVNVLTVALAQLSGRPDLLATTLPYAQINPRKPGASWNARRSDGIAPARETYVLVIGESVRADRLQSCGGRHGVAPSAPDTLVFCDVMASSSSTHTSVPLLMSRELPGGPLRVSRDATFMHAFAEVGFRTSWVSVQERSIAWPDAQSAVYVQLQGSDRASLLAPVSTALGSAPDRQLLVVHTYNAHFNYCDRLGGAKGLVPLDCASLGALPTRARRDDWLASYDNAVYESMRFLDAVIEAADTRGGEVFVVYVPDHGENLLDDSRDLFQHALQQPTRWDTRVPLIVHANAAWRERNAAKWTRLSGNRGAALIHADIVPTLLGAAGIAYDEPRTGVSDLTVVQPGARTRWVLRRLGQVTDGDRL